MLLEQLFIATALVGACLVLLNIVGVSMYDVRLAKQLQRQRHNPKGRQYRVRPLITVLVPTHNDATTIERCLQSLLNSTHRKLEIIVIDALSTDGTRQIVKRFIKQHPHQSVKLAPRRAHSNDQQGIRRVFKENGHGALVMVCAPTSTVDVTALGNAVQHFNNDPTINVVSLATRAGRTLSVSGLFQKYEYVLRARWQKLMSVAHTSYAAIGDSAIYRADSFRLLYSRWNKGAMRLPGSYAGNSVVFVAPTPSLHDLLSRRFQRQLRSTRTIWHPRRFTTVQSRFIAVSRWLLLTVVSLTAIFVPLLLTYFIYLAIRMQEPTLLLISGAGLGLFVLFAVWGDDQFSIRQKAGYTLLMPITYSIFYILSFVQIFVVVGSVGLSAKGGDS